MRWLLLLLSLPALAQAQQPVATQVQVRGADCALFPATARLTGWWDEQLAGRPRFTPTVAQATEAERALPVGLRQLRTAQPALAGHHDTRQLTAISTHLANYRRQYVGLRNARQQPCLLINFFYKGYAAPQDAGWLRDVVMVDDGGTGFWRIGYNLRTHRFFGFAHNPEG